MTFFLFVGLLGILGLSSSSVDDGRDDAAQRIAQMYEENFRLFQGETNKLAEMAQGPFDLSALREQLAKTRYAFKRVEYLFDYFKTEYNYLYINGAPLPKINKEDVNGPIVPPNGLQALDELVFSEEAETEREKIAALATSLKERVDFIVRIHLPLSLSDTQVMEALRSGIVRVFALGVTGFDTPGSGNGIEEAQASIAAMEQAFILFIGHVKDGAQEEFGAARKLFRKAFYTLGANKDFDTFDRMAFLKEAVNPLYGKLLDFQIQNGIDTGQVKYQAQNFHARNLFEENFLSRKFYTQLSYIPLETPAAIELGKKLFYDPILSGNGEMSCATCHDPNRAFTDGLPKSRSHIPGKFTRRNSPTLIDATFSSRFFWDMREITLERQVAHVVHDTLEFNTDFYQIAERLQQDSAYERMFREVYGEIGGQYIYSRSIGNALAAYVNTLASFNSEFDRYVRNESASYPPAAIRGFNLFMGKAACGTCHFVPVFNGLAPPFYTETDSEVLGLTLGLDTLHPRPDPDPGRAENGIPKDARPHYLQSFKTVSVRNAALTAPYMHNGLFNTLEEVMEFYDRGGGAGMGLDIPNQTLPSEPLNLTEREKADIITFMQTLTDTSGLTVERVVPEGG
ncbi:MAG: cytochrome-c peroxidase [Lewinellaceae bacterium]|nr:cytochrome-c peroxidase [Lewinellaceae bacterium]